MGRFRDTAGAVRSWLAAPIRPGYRGVRPVDVVATAAVIAAVELNNTTAAGAEQPLNAVAYAWGAAVAIPILMRHRWPRGVLVACAVLLMAFYVLHQRDISPAPLLCLPLFDAAAAGFLALSIIIPVFYMTVGLIIVQAARHQSLASLIVDFLPSIVVLLLAVLLGDAVHSRRALAAQTAERLRLAEEERETEAARRVAEERLRIARELHDTVAHSMATITVRAASALHVLGPPRPPDADPPRPPDAGAGAPGAGVRDALAVIRDTSKNALADIRVTLGQLRADDAAARDAEPRDTGTAGLGRLATLCDAVRAAGAPVTVTVTGPPVPLPPAVDHAAYRILQECLTNVLRHAGPHASAAVQLSYGPTALTVSVADNGAGGDSDGTMSGSGPGAGGDRTGRCHGLTGMAERAAALGGELSARPRPAGGFEVISRLPLTAVTAAGDAPAP